MRFLGLFFSCVSASFEVDAFQAEASPRFLEPLRRTGNGAEIL
jgi:hypothetical protein